MPKRRPKVMLVDDATTIRRKAIQAIAHLDVEVIEAGSAPEGLRRVREHPDVDVVVLDVNMVGMSGIDMLETMKAEHLAPRATVIMMTTERTRELVLRAKRAGAAAWITKPFKADLFTSAIEALLSKESP